MTKQFTSRKPKLSFSIDEDDFTAYAVLPARKFAQFAAQVGKLQRASSGYTGDDRLDLSFDETVTIILEAVELALPEDDAIRLANRISDPENPVDMNTLTELLTWVLEQWGLVAGGEARPTQPPSGSSSGPETTGAGSEES